MTYREYEWRDRRLYENDQLMPDEIQREQEQSRQELIEWQRWCPQALFLPFETIYREPEQ